MNMNKIKFILIILTLTLSACFKQDIKNLDNKGVNIICFGDSITFGYGAGPKEDYPTELERLLNEPVINAGVDGDTTYQALERLERDVLCKNPKLVIVEFCGNDFIKKITQDETVKNLKEIVRRIQETGAMVALVDISSGMFFQDYRWAFKRIASDNKAIFVPEILSKIITNPSMKSDFFHPNVGGYKLVAERIYKRIVPYLRNQNEAVD